MILSKIGNVKPEPKLGNEQQPIVSTLRPAIGNTNVGRMALEAYNICQIINDIK